jgi:uncharacterized protein YbbC (DUF1343 family)
MNPVPYIYLSAIDAIDAHDGLLRGRRLGLITNPSGVNAGFVSTATLLAARYNLVALYGPEHGVRGDAQAGEAVGNSSNGPLGIPEYSLYGRTSRLTPAMLAGVELMLFDIQDIGSRFYTYIYTLGEAMEACAGAGIPLIVLDRPNPLGGHRAEGTVIRPAFHSGVGNYGLTARHPLTVGEMARRIRRLRVPACDLTVLPCPAWNRSPFPAGGSWLNPSPNMPSATAALVYNGTCLFEGANISEGRGTTRPYEIIGAPFVDAEHLAANLNEQQLPGVRFRPCCFTPTFSKHQGALCHGLQLHVTDADAFNGFETGVILFQTLRATTPEMAITNPSHLNNLFGDDALLRGEEPLDDLLARARTESAAFLQETAVDLIYP